MSIPSELAKAIFLEATEKHAPEEWPAFLDQRCGGDAGLRSAVERLLRARAELGSFYEDAPVDARPPLGPTLDEPIAEGPGTMVGPYKLLEQIGEGGFGVVFMAEQTQPVRRKVALKILKAGMDTKQVVARFEAERQALAIMDHPNIAKVFDGGATASEGHGRPSVGVGRPYFVMELVKGVPITQFCDEQKLSPRQRLELFVPVCQAIQHAHQKGIIHRDLKPSNVLVSRHDTTPIVKVIDFGVAKALGQELTDKTLFTGLAQMIGTPLYMSPEQAGMSDLDVDTRSDIYSLGVLLYELLTGTTPFSKERFRQAAYDEIRRIIREEEPPKPSTRLSDSGAALASISAQRHMEPAKLTKLVRGELDWIVMKALEKDRARRYETANGFAMDVQRYLADEPVLACPPSAGYRLRKFARRNRARLAMAAVLGLLFLVAGAFAWHTAWQGAQRRAEAEKRDGDERARLGRNAEAVALLLDQSEDALRADREDRAAIALEAAERRASEGGAEELATRLVICRADLDLLRELNDIDAFRGTVVKGRLPKIKDLVPRWRAALAAYGITADVDAVADVAGRVNRSPIRDRVLTVLDQWLIEDRSTVLRALLRAADPDPYRDSVRDALAAGDGPTLAALVRRPEALAQPARFAAVLGQHRAVPTDRRREVLIAALRGRPGDLTLLSQMAQSYPDSRPWAAEQLRWRQAAVAAHPESAVAHNNLAIVLDDLKEFDAAIAEYKEAIRLAPKIAAHYHNLGATLVSKRNLDAAIAEFQKAIQIDPKSAMARTGWGQALEANKDVKGAIAKYREAIEIDQKFAPARVELAEALEKTGDVEGAIAQYEEAIRIDPNDASARSHLGVALWKKNDLNGALARYEEAIQIDPEYATAHTNRGVVLWQKGNRDEAMPEILEGVRLDPDNAHANSVLGKVLMDTGDQKGAFVHLRKAVLLDPDDADYPCDLGTVLLEKGDLDDAITQLKAALNIDPEHVMARNNLAAAFEKQGRPDLALPLLEQLATEIEKGRFRHENAETTIRSLVLCHERLKQFGQAESWRRKWLAMEKRQSGGDSQAYASALVLLGRNLLLQEKWSDAESVLREWLSLREQKSPNSWKKFEVKSMLGAALLGQKRYADAEPLLLDGYEGMKAREKTLPATVKLRMGGVADRLVQLYDATAKKDDAAKWRAIHEQHEGTKVGAVHEVGNGLKLRGKLDGTTTTLVYDVKLTAGKTYVIDMVSPDRKALDPFLVLIDPDGDYLENDNDGGGGLNARITYRVVRAGVYRIRATSFDASRGDFTLTVGEKKDNPTGLVDKKRVDASEPQDAAAWINRGARHHKNNDLPGAIDAFKKAVAIDPQNAKAWNKLGNALDDINDLPGAIDAFKKAVAIEPKNAKAWFNLGVTLRASKDLPGAIDAFKKTLAIDDQVADAWNNLGVALHESKDTPGAIEALKKALAIDPHDAEAWNNLGGALKASNDFPGAIAAFKKALAIDDEDATVWHNLGIALSANKDVPGAIAAYKKAIALDQQDAEAHNDLAWLLATCADVKLRDPKQAVDLAKRAVELAPKNPGYPNTLGAAYYRTGDFKAAIAALEKSMKVRKGGDSFDWFFLAMAQWKLGEKDKARELYERAVRWMDMNQPKNEELRRFRSEAAELQGVNVKKD